MPQTPGERVKILATIGPASQEPKVLTTMIQAGVDAVRINASHVSPAAVGDLVGRIRRAGKKAGRDVAVLLDLQGIKRRIGDLPEPLELHEGDTVVLGAQGGPGRIPIRARQILPHLEVGADVFLDDGFLRFRVTELHPKEAVCEVVRGGMLPSRAGINLPGVRSRARIPTAADREHIAAGVAAGVDLFAVSFVRDEKDLWRCRKHAHGVPLVAKIELPEAVENIQAIAHASDGILVARGDLAVEIRPEELPVLQKQLVASANRARKPVIVATEMLASMVHSPRPTRAELTDVGNAVLDGTDATLLSDETAIGFDPVRAVRYMARIVATVERSLLAYNLELPHPQGEAADRPDWAVADAAVEMAAKVGARAIVAMTGSGRTARLISAGRPSVPIFSFSPDPAVRRRTALMWGVTADALKPLTDPERMIAQAARHLRRKGWAVEGDRVVFVHGSPLWGEGTKTNTVRVATV
jgi:pyruvate kinase